MPDPARVRSQLVLHGAIVLFCGLAAGGPYNMALRHGWGDEPARGWMLAHSAGVMCGGMALAIAGVMHLLRLPDRARAALVGLVVLSIYAFTIGMWTAPILAVRGILPWKSAGDRVVNLFYTVAAASALCAGAVLIAGAAAACRGGDPTTRSDK